MLLRGYIRGGHWCAGPLTKPHTRQCQQRTSEPPATELLIIDAKGTSAGSAARISRVGASNFGLTSTKNSFALPSNGKRRMSSGLADLQA